MSIIAKELYDEIEAPLKDFKGSFSKTIRNARDYDNKVKKSVVIEKHKCILPHKSNHSRVTFWTEEEIIDKTYIDSAANTTITGPINTNNNCMTAVRQRETKNCACPQRPRSAKSPQRVGTKNVQTFSRVFPYLDKACYYCAETSTCGTQYVEEIDPQYRNYGTQFIDELDESPYRSKEHLFYGDSNNTSRRNSKVIIVPPRSYTRQPATIIVKKEKVRKSDDSLKTVLRPPDKRKSYRLTQTEGQKPDCILRHRLTEVKKSRNKLIQVEREKNERKGDNIHNSDYRLKQPDKKKSDYSQTDSSKKSYSRMREPDMKTSNNYIKEKLLLENTIRLKQQLANTSLKLIDLNNAIVRQEEMRKRDLKLEEETRKNTKQDRHELQMSYLSMRLPDYKQRNYMDSGSHKLPSVNFMGARRWSLSRESDY